MIAVNRKARFEYQILEEYESGIVLIGSEVKSIRLGNVTIVDSFIYIKDNEVWLKNLKVSKYDKSHPTEKAHEDSRDKKLLLTKKEINKIGKSLEDRGITCIATSIFTKNNKIKINIALAKGKKLWDKRNTIKERDIKRENSRLE